jgi:hypothetical protein
MLVIGLIRRAVVAEAARQRSADDSSGKLVLTEEHRMLLTIRDTLYEGSWADFAADLEARRRSAPHVFQTVPDSPQMLATIGSHLALIDEMRSWEGRTGRLLHADEAA